MDERVGVVPWWKLLDGEESLFLVELRLTMIPAQGDLLDLFRADDPEAEEPVEDHLAVICPWKKLSRDIVAT